MISVSYVRQKEALGLGHAILAARDNVGDEPFAVMLGDDIIDSEVPCLKQMMHLFEKLQASIIATCEVPLSEISHYGVIRGFPVEGFNGRVYRVQDVVEKPPASEAPSNLAIIGRYILTPQIFSLLEKTRIGKWRRNSTHGWHPASSRTATGLCLHVRRNSIRRWRQTWLSESNCRIRP